MNLLTMNRQSEQSKLKKSVTIGRELEKINEVSFELPKTNENKNSMNINKKKNQSKRHYKGINTESDEASTG